MRFVLVPALACMVACAALAGCASQTGAQITETLQPGQTRGVNFTVAEGQSASFDVSSSAPVKLCAIRVSGAPPTPYGSFDACEFERSNVTRDAADMPLAPGGFRLDATCVGPLPCRFQLSARVR